MKASSLSGECARRREAVFGVAAGVDMFVTILALGRSPLRRSISETRDARAFDIFDARPAFGVRVFLRESCKTGERIPHRVVARTGRVQVRGVTRGRKRTGAREAYVDFAGIPE